MQKGVLSSVRRLKRDQKGSAAIEFAIVALPLFFLIFATLEYGFVMLKTAILESTMNDITEQVATGQVTGTSMSTDIRNMVRDKSHGLFRPEYVYVRFCRLTRIGIVNYNVSYNANEDRFQCPTTANGPNTNAGELNVEAGNTYQVEVYSYHGIRTPFIGPFLATRSNKTGQPDFNGRVYLRHLRAGAIVKVEDVQFNGTTPIRN